MSETIIKADITQTDAYHEAREELNNDIINAIENHFGKSWDDIPLALREKAFDMIEDTLQVIATVDTAALEGFVVPEEEDDE